jgi:predicted membrane-bound dolichyl-phosphate-mannose-protein mannosyltransferase
MELFSKHGLGLAVRENARRYYRWEYFWLSLIVIVYLILHLSIVLYPKQIILDEIHYITDARSIISDNGTQRPEHPPLAKLIIVAGIKAAGDNPWDWRVIPIIFGTLSVIFFYIICRRLNMSRAAATLATFLLAFENLFFMLSGLAMLDVYYVTFMLAAFLFYLYRRYISSGVTIGLSALSKLNGALALPTVGIHWLFSREQKHNKWIILTIIFSIIAFLGLMPLLDMIISQKISGAQNPIAQVKNMLSLTDSLTFASVTHPSKSPPWEWIINYKVMPFYYIPHYSSAISFSVWAFIIPTFLYMLYLSVKRNEAGLFGAAWFFATYIIWIPATIITDRVTYPYYFYPAVGAICLGMGIWLGKLFDIFRDRPRGKLKWFALSVVIVILLAHVISFLILSPFIPVDFFKWVGVNTTY